MKKKTPLSAREAAFKALIAVEKGNAYANLEFKRVLGFYAVTPEDARLAAHIVYGTARRKNALDHILSGLLTQPIENLKPETLVVLRLSLYQLHYLNKTEAYAVTNEGVELAKKYGGPSLSRLTNAVLRNYLRKDKNSLLPTRDNMEDYITVTLSYPRWMAKYFIRSLGEEGAELLALALNEYPGLWLRANELKLRREELIAALKQHQLEAVPAGFAYETLRAETTSGNLAAIPAFQNGGCTVQGPASQMVAHALSPEAGSRVLDLCAAPGGKCTHMAALMNNKGEIVACDIHAHKLDLIRENLDRLGVTCVKTHCGDSTAMGEEYHEWADYVLLDAPCSGLGVLNTRADSRFHREEEDIQRLAELSYSLLEAAAGYVKPGGVICYSTCTVTAEENSGNIRRFLASHPEFKPEPMEKLAAMLPSEADKEAALAGQIQFWPHIHGTEGFFIAAVRKHG